MCLLSQNCLEACLFGRAPSPPGLYPGGGAPAPQGLCPVSAKRQGAPGIHYLCIDGRGPQELLSLGRPWRTRHMDNAKKMYTLPEAAKLAGVSEDELRCAIKDGLLQAEFLQNTGEYHLPDKEL